MGARHVYVRKTKHVYVCHHEIWKKNNDKFMKKVFGKKKKGDNSPIKILRKCKKVEEVILKN